MQGRVLIVDDEPDIRELLEITLGRMSLDTVTAADLGSAIHLLATEKFNLCLTDMRLPDGDGLDLVLHIQKRCSDMPVAVITAHGSTETAIKALKSGAFDFVSKPVDLAKLRDLVTSALTLNDSSNATRDSSKSASMSSDAIVGSSQAVQQMKLQISKLARSQAPIYISGESGSGKELAARAIHDQSSRSQGAFVAVNCGAIPEELVESELFGHVKGSFTGANQDKQGLFQAAEGGTLFLDEVADLPLHTQVKLLRVIQEKALRGVGSQKEVPVNVRILSATHRNLAKEVEEGSFRQDLYYRINVIELPVPSLRERREDIPELASHILEKISRENGVQEYELSPDALENLKSYDFPGNIRELENILQRAATLSENQIIDTSNLDLTRPIAHYETANMTDAELHAATNPPELVGGFSLEKHLEAIEIKAIEKALSETRWNKTKAAKKLGMSFRALRYRLKKLGLE
ncbi:MAG: sigma-54 dependent transcriptional regulator [Pseudohongiellaceae bacterium]